MSDSVLRSVAVFCGSRDGTRPEYLNAATTLGMALARADATLVYGGSRFGVMGRIASACIDAGGSVVGVLPDGLAGKERAHPGLSELHRVTTMHERKQKMAALSDAFIVMPGGFGTLEEGFEMLTWTQLGIHRKPIGILNVDGFYDTLLAFMDEQVDAGFVTPSSRELITVDDSAERLLTRLATPKLPDKVLWQSA